MFRNSQKNLYTFRKYRKCFDMGLETEKKFLIEMPHDIEKYSESYADMEQTYLTGGTGTERVRKSAKNGDVVYTHTEKITLTAMTRIENEEIIDYEQYKKFLLRCDPKRKTIIKRRYYVKNDGRIFEIDIYPFWKNQAVMEVELEGEDAKFTPPTFIRIIRDVTDDKNYSNSNLSLKIPKEIRF